MKKKLKRYKHSRSFYKSLCFQKKSEKIYIDLNTLKRRFKLDGIIKFLPYDFKFLKKKFYHFNLEYAHHKKNKKYLIIKIKKKGFYDGKKETLPIYDINNLSIYKCFLIRQKIKYDSIDNYFYKNALKITSSKKKLLNSILRRYKYLQKKYTKDKIINSGVSITGLKFCKNIDFKNII